MKISKIQRTAKGLIKITKPVNILFAMMMQFFVYLCIVPEDLHDFVRSGMMSVSMALVMAAGYLINAYYDIKIDMVNRPHRVVVGKYLSRRKVMLFHVLFSVAGIVLGFLADFWIGMLDVGLVFLLWLYSNQLKRIALVGNMLLAFLSTCILWSVGVFIHSLPPQVLVYSVFAFFLETNRHLLKDIVDYKGDETYGVKTLPVIVGTYATKQVIYLLAGLGIVISLIWAVILQNIMLLVAFMVLSVMVLVLMVRLYFADRRTHFRFLANACKVILVLGIATIWIS